MLEVWEPGTLPSPYADEQHIMRNEPRGHKAKMMDAVLG